jgi:hypothetical protein
LSMRSASNGTYTPQFLQVLLNRRDSPPGLIDISEEEK